MTKKTVAQLEAYKAAGEVLSMLFYGGIVKAMMPKMTLVVLPKDDPAHAGDAGARAHARARVRGGV